MGTPCELQLYAAERSRAQQAADATRQDVLRLEARYSRYRDDSLLSVINRVAGAGGRIEVDTETAGLLDYATTCFEQSDGLFDITSGILRKAWNFKSTALPEPQLVQSLLNKVGWQRVGWNASVLNFSQPGMELDLGGVVKEYAADRAVTLCFEAGIRHGMVNLGGDIRIIGAHPDGSPWRVGIRHPREPGALLQTLELFSGALASSGDYERCIVVGDKRYGHVLNPKTGWPVEHLAAVSVVAELCVIAGSASTVGMLKEANGAQWLQELGLPHIWVGVDGAAGAYLCGSGPSTGEISLPLT